MPLSIWGPLFHSEGRRNTPRPFVVSDPEGADHPVDGAKSKQCPPNVFMQVKRSKRRVQSVMAIPVKTRQKQSKLGSVLGRHENIYMCVCPFSGPTLRHFPSTLSVDQLAPPPHCTPQNPTWNPADTGIQWPFGRPLSTNQQGGVHSSLGGLG